MKLKKIVSLALAGVLAVSMLAGCKGNSSSSSTPNEPTEPVASGLSVKLGKAMDDAMINAKVNFVDNSELDSALQHAIGDVGDNTVAGGALLPGNVVYASGLMWVPGLAEAYDTLEEDVDPTFGMVAGTPNATIVQIAPNNIDASDAKYDEDGVSTIMLFVVESGVVTDNIIEQIGDDLKDDLKALVNSYAYGVGFPQNGNVNYKYDLSVASSSKTFVDADTTLGLTLIAVELTRNIVE